MPPTPLKNLWSNLNSTQHQINTIAAQSEFNQNKQWWQNIVRNPFPAHMEQIWKNAKKLKINTQRQNFQKQ